MLVNFTYIDVDTREIITSPTSPHPKVRIIPNPDTSTSTTKAVNIATSSGPVTVQCHLGLLCQSPQQTTQGYHELDEQPSLRQWFCPHCAQQKSLAEQALAQGAKRIRKVVQRK